MTERRGKDPAAAPSLINHECTGIDQGHDQEDGAPAKVGRLLARVRDVRVETERPWEKLASPGRG